MADNITEITTHDYEPLNQYIDERARIRRTRSFWGYSKSAVLLMVGVGLLAVLLAWAYYLYKKPHRLVSLDNIQEQVLKNEERLIDAEKKLPTDEEINILTGEKLLQKRINKKNQEILDLKKQMENNKKLQDKEVQDLRKQIEDNQGDEELKAQLKALEEQSQKQEEKMKAEKEDLEKETERLEDKLTQQVQVQTDVIHFKSVKTSLAGQSLEIVTRLHYADPRQHTPTEVTCYVQFLDRNLANVELGDKNIKEVYVPIYLKNKFNVRNQDFINLKNKYCQYDYN